MRRGSWTVGSAIVLVAVWAVGQEKEEGFISLFNGQDLSGWHVTGGPRDAAKAWSVKDGVIDCSGKPEGGWLRSDKAYRDFVLRLEYKIGPRKNSGIFLRATQRGNPAYTGMEIQVFGDHPAAAPSRHGNGSVYGAIPPTSNPQKLDDWNEVEIELRGMHLKQSLNGIEIMDVRLDDPEWNKDLRKRREFTNRAPEGYIGMQNHGSPVQFRNIRIKPL